MKPINLHPFLFLFYRLNGMGPFQVFPMVDTVWRVFVTVSGQ